ncbi:MAG: hypothetical protein F4Z07_04445 [Dehalococcoidia bacterium]|nr:hypothetical protein [Dehalococcoidia bacterium]
MAYPGHSHDAHEAANRASRRIQQAVNPHRPPDGVLDLGPRDAMKEARRRYEQENPSRIRWLFKIGEWINRHT